MRATLLILTFVMLAPSLHAQRADAGALPTMRSTAVVAGLGTSMGWLGLQGEKYLGNDQLSRFGGIGWAPTGSRDAAALIGIGFGYTWRR